MGEGACACVPAAFAAACAGPRCHRFLLRPHPQGLLVAAPCAFGAGAAHLPPRGVTRAAPRVSRRPAACLRVIRAGCSAPASMTVMKTRLMMSMRICWFARRAPEATSLQKLLMCALHSWGWKAELLRRGRRWSPVVLEYLHKSMWRSCGSQQRQHQRQHCRKRWCPASSCCCRCCRASPPCSH